MAVAAAGVAVVVGVVAEVAATEEAVAPGVCSLPCSPFVPQEPWRFVARKESCVYKYPSGFSPFLLDTPLQSYTA